MKILFLGDYSNLHACLGARLKELGHDVTIVSDGGRYMDTRRDILLDRKPGKLGSIQYLAKVISLIPRLRGYDIVQLANPHFLTLRPRKIRYFFDILKRNNGSVFLTLAGNDYNFVKKCMEGEMFRFSEFKVGNEYTEYEKQSGVGRGWTAEDPRRLSEYMMDSLDGGMSVLAEYDMASKPILGERLTFTGLPVDLSELPYAEPDLSGKVNFFFGIRSGMEVQKGTARLLEMCRKLGREYPDKCSVTRVSDIPLKEYLKLLAKSTVVVDQHYSYSPGTNGFQAMALGKVAATGGQPEFYEYMDEPDRGALIPLSPLKSMDEWYETFRSFVLDPSPIPEMTREGRRIVERHNDVRIVANKFVAHWERILDRK